MNMNDRIEEAAENYVNSIVNQRDTSDYSQDVKNENAVFDQCDMFLAFYAGTDFMQWHDIERDKDGFAIDTTLGKVLIMDDSEEVYINDDDDYIHNTHCVYWMPIPSLPKELK